MKTINRVMVALALGAIGACGSSSPYYYDPYYGYYPVVYDDYYYDAAMMGGYYYYPDYYYYSYQVQAASISVAVVPPGVRLLLERWAAPIDPACLTATTTGDSDHDGIDANSTITFQCNSTPAGGTAQVSGSVTVHDLDDAAADAGYSLTFDGFKVRVVSATGSLLERVVNGTETIQKVDNGIRLVRNLVVNGTNTYPDGVQRPGTLEMNSQGLLTPEIVPGSTQVTRGTLVLSGTGTFTGPDGVPINISRQTDPNLHWNNDCTKVAGNQGPYDAGAIVYRSSQGRQTRIVHNSCTSVIVTNSTVPAQ